MDRECALLREDEGARWQRVALRGVEGRHLVSSLIHDERGCRELVRVRRRRRLCVRLRHSGSGPRNRHIRRIHSCGARLTAIAATTRTAAAAHLALPAGRAVVRTGDPVVAKCFVAGGTDPIRLALLTHRAVSRVRAALNVADVECHRLVHLEVELARKCCGRVVVLQGHSDLAKPSNAEATQYLGLVVGQDCGHTRGIGAERNV